MADLRAPDPTLDALGVPVGIIHRAPSPAIAHRLPKGPGHLLSACGERMPDAISSTYAAYFAVPCRACFPAATPPGTGRECLRPGCRTDHNRHLAWQVTDG